MSTRSSLEKTVSRNSNSKIALSILYSYFKNFKSDKRPKRIEFVVGTQINGTPHIGNNLTQAAAFVLAQQARGIFSVDTSVTFNALDNAPFEIKLDPETHHAYQLTYFHALGELKTKSLIEKLYRSFFDGLSDRTDVEYQLLTYSDQQTTPEYRRAFLRTLSSAEKIQWCLSPSNGILHTRLPCPECFWAEKRAERTKLLKFDKDSALFEAFCFDHLSYEVEVSVESTAYLDLNTLYRNLLKEAMFCGSQDSLYVIIKGGDWAFGCPPIDWALNILGYTYEDLSIVRLFTPQIVTDTGAKLSKSLIKRGEEKCIADSCAWMLETSSYPGPQDDYIDTLLWLVNIFVRDPKHFFRAYSYMEVERLMRSRPPIPEWQKKARPMRIYRKYYDMIASGEKTIEIRVGYSSMKRIQGDQLIRFMCQDDSCFRRVVRVSEYSSFEDLFAHEDPKKINPHATAEEQIKEVSKIFPPDKEALGVLAIEIKRVPEDD